MGFALCVQISALSWILNSQYGLNLEQIGLVWLAGPLAGIFGQVIAGLVSDNVWFMGGRRRPLIVIGGTIAALMILALPFLDVIGASTGIGEITTIALIVALTLDLAINISFNPARSIIADVTPAGAARTKGFTVMQTISGAFGVAAYLISVLINNYFLIYVGAIIVFLFSAIPVFFIQEPRHLTGGEDREIDGQMAAANDNTIDEVVIPKSQSSLNQGTNWPEFIKICIAHAFTWVGVQTMFIYTFGYIKSNIMAYDMATELDQETNDMIGQQIGIAFAVLNTVGFLLPALVLEPVARRIGRVKTHSIAIATSAFGYLLIVFFGSSSIWMFGGLMAVVGVGWAAVVSLPFAMMTETVDQRKMGLMMGLFNLSVVLPQVVASLLGGYIEHAPDKSLIFMISAGTLAVSAVLWLLVSDQESGVAEGAVAGAGGGH